MKDTTSSLNQRIAERAEALRAARALSLDALSANSGVSRSMISLIERGESSPTAVVLEKLAAGLGVPQPTQIVEIEFPPGQRVAFEAPLRETGVYQQIWVLEGTIDVTVGDERHRLCEGDCLTMQLPEPCRVT